MRGLKMQKKNATKSDQQQHINTTDEVDPIEKCIGSFGKYHLFVYLLILFGRLPTDFQLSNVVFLIPPAVYTCNSTALCPCDEPQYDTSVFESTIVMSWDLICDRSWLASFSQSIYQAGVLAGSLVFSALSDRFGRKNAIATAQLLCPLAVTGSALTADLWLLVLLRFLTGAGVGGTMLCSFILNVELVGKNFRPYMCGLDNLSYVIGYLTIPGIAYALRDWRYLQLVTSSVWIVLVIPLYWLLPESPRWLIAVGKKEEAIRLLAKISKWNGRSNSDVNNIKSTIEEYENITKSTNKEKRSFVELFKSSNLRNSTIFMSFIWMMCSFGFFGVNQYFGRLGVNVYLNVFISACVHIPALLISTYIALKVKRRNSLWFTFGIATLTLFSLIFVPETYELIRILIGAVGVSSMFISFTVIYLYSSELFPTVVRNSALGIASMMARVGAFIAPFVVDIGVEWISLLMFGSASLLAALACCLLSETKGIVLRNHIDHS